MKFLSYLVLFIFIALVASPQSVLASGNPDGPVPGQALLRSFVLPGWGQHYVNPNDWNRGKVHLGADIALLGSYFGFRMNANRLENNLYTFARSKAGVDISGRGRAFLLNVSAHNSLQDYNDFQERSRNWDQILPVTPQNTWNWSSEADRLAFIDLDNRAASNRQQLPAIVSLMIVNRVVSGIHAFTSARNQQALSQASLTFTIPEGTAGHGVQANFRLSF